MERGVSWQRRIVPNKLRGEDVLIRSIHSCTAILARMASLCCLVFIYIVIRLWHVRFVDMRLTFDKERLTLTYVRLTSNKERLTFAYVKLTFLEERLTSAYVRLAFIGERLTFVYVRLTFVKERLPFCLCEVDLRKCEVDLYAVLTYV